MISNILSFHIKRTNKHFYLFVRNTTTQLITVSTDSRGIKEILSKHNKKEFPAIVGNLFAHRLINSGILRIKQTQTNRYHGKIATIIESIRKVGISVE